MPDTPPTTPPTTDEELTPQEEKKFSRFLAKFLVEDDEKHDTSPTPPTAPTPTAPAQGGSLESAINAVLDRRDKDSTTAKTLDQLIKDVADLKGKPQGKKRPWFSPLLGD